MKPWPPLLRSRALFGVGGASDSLEQIVVVVGRLAPFGAHLVEADVGSRAVEERRRMVQVELCAPAQNLDKDIVHRIHCQLLVMEQRPATAHYHGSIASIEFLYVYGQGDSLSDLAPLTPERGVAVTFVRKPARPARHRRVCAAFYSPVLPCSRQSWGPMWNLEVAWGHPAPRGRSMRAIPLLALTLMPPRPS